MPEEILDKPAPLTSAEWRTVVQHPRIGQVILEHAAALQDAVPIILHHHERYAGHGYPYGLRANEIPLGARIVAIADAYDAMTHDRPYKRAISHDAAIVELQQHAGTQFDPELVTLFCDLYTNEAPRPDPTVLAMTDPTVTVAASRAPDARRGRPRRRRWRPRRQGLGRPRRERRRRTASQATATGPASRPTSAGSRPADRRPRHPGECPCIPRIRGGAGPAASVVCPPGSAGPADPPTRQGPDRRGRRPDQECVATARLRSRADPRSGAGPRAGSPGRARSGVRPRTGTSCTAPAGSPANALASSRAAARSSRAARRSATR